MNQEFKDLILANYADLCIDWRREVVSCRSNASELNDKLTSLEGVIGAFEIAVPGLFDSQPPSASPDPIAAPTTAEYEVKVASDSEEGLPKVRKAKVRKVKPEPERELTEA